MKTDEALLLIDVQNDFCPGGSLAVSEGDQIVPVLNEYIQRFARDGRPIVASRDWHPAVTKHFKAYGGAWPPHCVEGTPGAEFHANLQLPEQAIVVSKGADPEADSYSAFEAADSCGRPLARVLDEMNVKRLYVGGLATDYCVKSSVLDALKAGFQVRLLTDAIRGVNLEPGDSEQALQIMQEAGAETITLANV